MALVDAIFFNVTLRLYCLRIVISASVGVLTMLGVQEIASPQDVDPYTVLIVILVFVPIVVHHLISVFALKYFFGIIDLVLVLLEIGATGFLMVVSLSNGFPSGPETSVLPSALNLIIFGGLLVLLISRIATVLRSPKSLFKGFDIYSCTPELRENHTKLENVFGRAIWKEQFVGEILPVRLLRGVLGTILLGGIAVYVLRAVVFKPIWETTHLPTKELRISYRTLLSSDLKLGTPVWNIQVDTPNEKMLDYIQPEVVPLGDQEDAKTAEGVPRCTPFPDDSRMPGFQCDWDAHQGILVTVNFTALYETPNPSTTVVLLLSFANQTGIGVEILRDGGAPFAVIPGINVVAAVSREVRQVFSKPSFAALGLFQSSKMFWASHIIGIYPDPSSNISRAENISTIRLLLVELPEMRVILDYTGNSVIDGFTAVGGLWTALSGIFAILFGARALFGSKPFSIFGIAHSFQHQRIKEEYKRQYPQIILEQQAPETKGLVALLRDHLIDLSFLEEKPATSKAVNSDAVGAQDVESDSVDQPTAEGEKLLPS